VLKKKSLGIFTVQMFHNSSETVAMSSDQNIFPFFDLGSDHIIPIRQRTLYRKLERFKGWEFLRFRFFGISWILHNYIVIRVVLFHWRWWYIKTTSPYLNLK